MSWCFPVYKVINYSAILAESYRHKKKITHVISLIARVITHEIIVAVIVFAFIKYFARSRMQISIGRFLPIDCVAETVAWLVMRLFQCHGNCSMRCFTSCVHTVIAIDKNQLDITAHL